RPRRPRGPRRAAPKPCCPPSGAGGTALGTRAALPVTPVHTGSRASDTVRPRGPRGVRGLLPTAGSPPQAQNQAHRTPSSLSAQRSFARYRAQKSEQELASPSAPQRHHGWRMLEYLLLLVDLLAAAARSRGALVTESLLLRQQLAVLTRPTRKQPRFRAPDKRFWVFVRVLRRDWRRHLIAVRPETV